MNNATRIMSSTTQEKLECSVKDSSVLDKIDEANDDTIKENEQVATSANNNNKITSTAVINRAALFPADTLWNHNEWHVTIGEQCIRKRMNCINPTIKFYTSWFCPFAQRTWITLEECSSFVKYKWYEINPYIVNSNNPGGYSKIALSISEKQKLYPDFIQASPYGLIPAIEHTRIKNSNSDNIESEIIRLHDSLVCCEYINKKYGKSSLIPTDEYEYAKVHLWCTIVEQRIQKQFYLALSFCNASTDHDKELQLLHIHNFLNELRQLANNMSTTGPYFCGKQFTLFEISFIPFYQRFLLLGPYYLKENFYLPIQKEKEFQRLDIWWKAVMIKPYVYNTFVCKQRLIASYLDYTIQNKATSNYAQTVLKN